MPSGLAAFILLSRLLWAKVAMTFTDNLLSFSSAPLTLPKVGFFMPKYVRVWSGRVEGHETLGLWMSESVGYRES